MLLDNTWSYAIMVLTVIVSVFISSCASEPYFVTDDSGIFDMSVGESIYEFNPHTLDGIEVPLSLYQGDVILIVNLGVNCNSSAHQYKSLQEIHEKYESYGFEVMAFPSNEFDGLDSVDKDIILMCKEKYNVTFPFFEIIHINGNDQYPLFDFLVASAPYYNHSADIEDNFAKFLIDREGQVYKRYHPNASIDDIENDIKLLTGLFYS